MNLPPDKFPLERVDTNGVAISEGDFVKILHIPDWLVSDLDDESLKAVKACEGKEMKIYEIDDYGYAWVETVTLETKSEYKSNSFCMEPKNLLKK
ncbi:hypothetical protein [Aurantivibrio infirmus]